MRYLVALPNTERCPFIPRSIARVWPSWGRPRYAKQPTWATEATQGAKLSLIHFIIPVRLEPVYLTVVGRLSAPVPNADMAMGAKRVGL